MFAKFAAQAGVIAFSPVLSPNVITPTLTWNFNNVIVFDYNPPGVENLNDRPRINVWRNIFGENDPNYLQLISGGLNVLSPMVTGRIVQPWGDRRTGTIKFPSTTVNNNQIIAGVDVFTHIFAPLKTGVLFPPIQNWSIDTTTVTGEIKYSYQFVVGNKNPQFNIEIDYKPECVPVTIPTCLPSQCIAYRGYFGINDCPVFECVNTCPDPSSSSSSSSSSSDDLGLGLRPLFNKFDVVY